MTLSDKTITCVGCGSDFQFTVGEQEYYASKDYANAPKRCPRCRELRKAQPRGPRQISREMHPATCSQCGINTTVPFKPREDRSVYCSDCFNQKRVGG